MSEEFPGRHILHFRLHLFPILFITLIFISSEEVDFRNTTSFAGKLSLQTISTIIAEDDLKNAEILNRFVSRLGNFRVEGIAQSLMQAIDMAEVHKPHLILLDNYFPDGHGTELLQHIRKKEFHIDVIMITASKDVSTIRDALHGGIFDYIIKPISYERLDDSLKKYQDYFFKLHNTEQLRQQDVDKLLKRNQNHNAYAEPRLPKGIDSLTLEKIRQHICAAKHALTAEEVGASIGTSRTTARRYLEYLVSLREVIADVSYGSVGRPIRLYKNNPK